MPSTTSKPPKFGRVIFVDRSLASKRLPAMLERMGFEVELHNRYFVPDAEDDIWIPEVAARQWVILTADKRLSVEPLNKEAVRSSNAQVLLVSDGKSLPEQWAACLIVGRLKIEQLLDRNPGPVFIMISKHAGDHVNVSRHRAVSAASGPSGTEPAVETVRREETP
jgi:hypothetical protein